VVHHIIFDGWSMGIFFSELSALYEGYGHGKDILLEPIRLQYKDFADRQQQYLESVGIDKHIVYWKEKLGQVPSFIPLPVDKARPSVQTFCGKTIEFQIPEDMYIQLKALNDKEESMMLMTTLTAYAALLTRVCCINDMVIGVPVADRTKKDYESVIGYFVNIVPIRVFIKDNPTFINMLAQVKETVLDAYDHQELPFEKLVELLKLPRNPSYSPLIQTMFHFHNQAQERLQLWDLVVENMDIDNHTSKFDLMLTLMETEKGLLGYWEYNTDLFEENTIHEFTGSLLELVRQITENPQMRINLVMEFKNQDQMVKPEFLPEADYPLTETELKLIEIFEAIFSKSHLKREDDFYSLGGHSLLIIQLISDIEKSFLMDLSVMDIMTNPMIGSLASVIDGMMNGK